MKESEVKISVSKTCYVLNEQTYELEAKAEMKYGKCGHQVAHLHRRFEFKTTDLIYAVGCKYPDDTAKRCEVYDVAKNQWAEIVQLHKGRHYHSISVLEGRYLYVIGGRDSMTEAPLDSIERLDSYSQEQSWELLEIANKDNQWSPRDTIGSFALSESELLIFGGD